MNKMFDENGNFCLDPATEEEAVLMKESAPKQGPEIKKSIFLPESISFYRGRGKVDPTYCYCDGAKIDAGNSEPIKIEGFCSFEKAKVSIFGCFYSLF